MIFFAVKFWRKTVLSHERSLNGGDIRAEGLEKNMNDWRRSERKGKYALKYQRHLCCLPFSIFVSLQVPHPPPTSKTYLSTLGSFIPVASVYESRRWTCGYRVSLTSVFGQPPMVCGPGCPQQFLPMILGPTIDQLVNPVYVLCSAEWPLIGLKATGSEIRS